MEEQQHHQPPPADRPDRQAGGGPLQPDRPAERDGRPRGRPAGAGLAGLSVHRRPRAPRRGRGVLGSPRGDDRREAGPDGGGDVPGPGIGEAQGDLDRGDQSRGQPARPASGPPRPGQGRAGRRAGPVPSDRDVPTGRRAAADGAVGREDLHQHQQRAARLDERAGRQRARPGPARLADPGEVRRGDGLSRLQVRRLGRGLGRVHQADRGPPLRHGGDDLRAAPGRPAPALALPERRPSRHRPPLPRPEVPDPRRPGPVPPPAAPGPARDDRPRVPADHDHRTRSTPTGIPSRGRASRPSSSSASRRPTSRSTPTTRPRRGWWRASWPS